MKRHDEDEDTIRDGRTLRVPLSMMDARQRAIASQSIDPALHRPGFRFGDGSDQPVREAARITREKLLADAWRAPLVPKYAAAKTA